MQNHNNIEKNTVELSAHVYDSPRECEYRWQISCDPDFPEVVCIRYQELAYYDNHTRTEYENRDGDLSFDKETWEKIKYAVDTVFSKTI